MKSFLLVLIGLSVFLNPLTAQVTDNFIVQGDIDKFYPVTFLDGGFDNNVATELSIGRSSVHIDSDWRGSCIGFFRFHTNNWGNSSNFIDADVKQFSITLIRFIAGWQDATSSNNGRRIIIWLKGGGTTYFYRSNYNVNPVIYDGIQSTLPFQEVNGPSHTYKTAVDSYVNNAGISYNHTAYFNGEQTNYFKGIVGIGTLNTNEEGYKLFVESGIRTRKVKVDQANWPDYVFHPAYTLRPLSELEQYVRQYHRLPEMPSAEQVGKDGLDLGDNQGVLLKKIEELTLYLIEQDKFRQMQARELADQLKKNEEQDKRLQELIQKIEQQQQLIKDLQMRLR